MVQFEHTAYLLLIVPAIAILVAIIRKDFAKIKKIQRRETFEERLKQRTLILITRSLILILLIAAMATPFELKTIAKSGDSTLTIFIDNSSSMELLDTSGIHELIDELQSKVSVRIKTFGGKDASPLGDALVAGMQGNDNILLISDGNENRGRSLGDMLVLAFNLNSTVNAINLKPAKDDSMVAIVGPRLTTNADENDFDIVVKQVGKIREYQLKVFIDDGEVLNGVYSGSNIATISKKFNDGYHVIKAEITINDHFKQNNMFLKVVKVEPKPKVLLVRKSETHLDLILNSLYDAAAVNSMFGVNLMGYSAVILDNIPESEIDVQRLTDYVIDGNGLVVFGGKNAYDRGGYKSSEFESMLPVNVGKGTEGKHNDVNIVLVIDISGSTGTGFKEGSVSRVEEVEKALAVGIINNLRNSDRVAVVAFNTEAFLVSELAPISYSKDQTISKIERLVYKGGTRIDEGIKAARKIMAPLQGSKNLIILSDGKSGSYTEDLYNAETAAGTGIKVFTVGVGEGTNRKHLQDLANVGNGFYFEPDETEQLKVIFGESEKGDEQSGFPLEIVNNHHFITRGLKISGSVSGFNQVVPKTNADMLVTTQSNNPILTVSRLGLGRIVAISTDDGSGWAPSLLSAENSILLTRSINWAVGDLSRNKEFDVNINDVHLGKSMNVNVIADAPPKHNDLNFAKVGKRLYTSPYMPANPGLIKFFDATAAVNYNDEYLALGVNPALKNSIAVTQGSLFDTDQSDLLLEKIKNDSKRIIAEPVSYSWMLLLAALIVFLLEIGYRKYLEGKTK